MENVILYKITTQFSHQYCLYQIYLLYLQRQHIFKLIKNISKIMSKIGSILLGVAAGTVAGIGVLFVLDKDKTLCKKNSIGDKVDELKDQIDSLQEKCVINQWS